MMELRRARYAKSLAVDGAGGIDGVIVQRVSHSVKRARKIPRMAFAHVRNKWTRARLERAAEHAVDAPS